MKIWDIYPYLTEIVKRDHDVAGMRGTGHDFDHALQAAQFALTIAESDEVRRLAGAAALCHNADRILQHQLHLEKKDVAPVKVHELVSKWLRVENFLPNQVACIVEAVIKHTEINKADDSDVLIALKDADRLTCTMADNIMTAAQFWSELPAIDPVYLVNDPSAHSYKNPKSVLKNLECRYDWTDESSPVCVRLPKAKELMKRRVNFIRQYIEEITGRREEIGLVPYPAL